MSNEEDDHREFCAGCMGPSQETPQSYRDRLREERGSFYGPVSVNHASIGMLWGGILSQAFISARFAPSQPVPPDIVCLMMAAVKLSREAYRHKQDNIDDAHNYLDYATECGLVIDNE